MKIFLAVDFFNKYSVYFSNPRSWIMWAIISLHDYMMFFLINILLVVLIFIFISFWVQSTFKNKLFLKNYVTMRIEEFNDAPLLEFFWTLLPGALLVAMAWPSFKILYAIEQLIDPFHTVVIVGNQWYWSYQYSDFDVVSDMIIQLDSKEGKTYVESILKKLCKPEVDKNPFLNSDWMNFNRQINYFKLLEFSASHLRKYEESKLIYDSVLIPDENLPLGYPRLLSTDQVLVLPANTSIRLLITSADVIHSWALPSHGIKMDAIPGRINQVGFLTPFWGTYRGQCSELCGINHGFMPIEVRVLDAEDYISYLKLNISYRFDKLIPILENCFKSYFVYILDKFSSKLFKFRFLDNYDEIFCTSNIFFKYAEEKSLMKNASIENFPTNVISETYLLIKNPKYAFKLKYLPSELDLEIEKFIDFMNSLPSRLKNTKSSVVLFCPIEEEITEVESTNKHFKHAIIFKPNTTPVSISEYMNNIPSWLKELLKYKDLNVINIQPTFDADDFDQEITEVESTNKHFKHAIIFKPNTTPVSISEYMNNIPSWLKELLKYKDLNVINIQPTFDADEASNSKVIINNFDENKFNISQLIKIIYKFCNPGNENFKNLTAVEFLENLNKLLKKNKFIS